ncbi:hypothetical protein TARUN_5373 [Trichoderma arundinaceum]|uniref:Uncharacterized protein n=1 Tax=Trichoderma arundinaceum TaxID=490622 RepID=A0A395NLD5_TRIAR|nr:hypothetical protein TARUN_5373 [Trichoderma arundinaceum]
MPRRRKSGFQPASFNLRWHSIADPNTPSVDIMSSPDPLNEPTISFPSFAPQSASRRVTRSQRSQRFISPADSARKQTFELEVGDSSSPERLLVTVETAGDGDDEEDDMATTTSGTRRKLFKSPVQSPTVRRMRDDDTITTTIPLRESAEDELTTAITPSRRRSRLRLSNGTPLPAAAGVKRRARSPIKRSPRRQRSERFGGGNTTELHFEEKENIQTTPKTAKRGRPPKNQAVEPPSEPGTTKRGRRRQAMAPDELVEIAEEAAVERSFVQNGRRTSESDAVDLIPAPSEQHADAASNADTESDIWMATMDDEETPRASAQPSTTQLSSKKRPPVGGSTRKDDHGHRASEASDRSSVDDHHDFSSQTNDTIAQGEDFSMIFMDSIPSLQASLNGNGVFVPTAHDDEELGEETHLIINNTLESLRQEVAQTSDPVDITEPIEIPELPDTEEQPEPEFVPIIRESARNARLSLSPWWSRKPKKMGSSPLRHQTLRSAAKRSGRLFKADHREDEPTPTRAGKQTTFVHSREDRSNDYDDSFSEIPQNYLDAPTPKPLNFSATQTDREVDLMEYGLQEEEQPQDNEEPAGEPEEDAPEEAVEEAVEEAPEEAVEEAEDVEEETVEDVAASGRLFARIGRAIGLGMRKLPTPDFSSPVRHIDEEEDGHTEHVEHEDYEEPEEYEEHEDDEEQQEVLEQEEFDQEHEQGLEEAEEEEEEEAEAEEEEAEEVTVVQAYEEQEVMEEHEEQLEVEELEEQEQEEEEEEEEEEELEMELEHEEQEEEMDEYVEQEELEELEEHEEHEEHEELEEHEEYEEHDEHDEPEEPEEPAEYSYEPLARMRASNIAHRHPENDGNHANREIRLNSREQQPEQLEPTPEHEEQPAKVTPLHQMSSPLQDPQSVPPQEHVQEKIVRPVLSSIMRAGRVLQSVTSDPPSPGDREKQLGSPFRSSTSKESSHSAKEDRHQLLSKSPPQSLNFGRDQLTISKLPVNHATTVDTDLLSMNADAVDQVLERNAREHLHKKRPSSRESVASSLGNTPQSGGAMSWVEKEGPISPSLRGDNTLMQAARLSSTRNTKEPIALGQVDGAGEELDGVEEVEEEEAEEEEHEWQEEQDEEQEQEQEGEEEEEVEEEEDDDDDIDIWEYEAQREVPPPVLQESTIPSVQDHGPASGPSSWRDAQRATEATATVVGLSNDQSKTSQMKRAIGRQSNENTADEEHSLVSRNQHDKEPETATKSKRFDLSSFFSSPAAIPGLLAEKFRSIKSKAPAEPATRAEPIRPTQELPTMPTTSMFPRFRQNENGSQNLRRTDPVSSPIQSDFPGNEQVVDHSSSPGTPERPHLPVIAQKQNFTPRPRQASNTFFQPSSSRATATPPRMQLSHEDIHKWQLETSNASEASPKNLRHLLRPLPSKHASPKKSSLRSPLKPHTPGRVVEFTSGVLSPQGQARIRAQRDRANVDASEEDISAIAATSTHAEPRAGKGSMGRQQQPPKLIPSRVIKPAGVTKKRPIKKRRRREPPSETVWTRQHWIFLDTLLQMRRQSPFSEEYEPVSQKYLGKVITSMDESMVLEKWHLECVDAFKSQIGGWDEGELAKRLFALILGEAKRRRSSVDQSPGVMFH